jgi:predicted tellurium resistance membrane protein TerC
MGVRIILLLTITWVMKFTEPLFSVPHWISEDASISGRDLILIFGGMFLIAKSTREINHQTEGEDEIIGDGEGKKKVNVRGIIIQIILLDIIFSFDSILTAVGLTNEVIIMIIAVIVSIGIMIIFSGRISDFINKHPSMEVLALGFLILIGFMIFLEGLDKDIPKGYIYFAVVFSMIIEMVNIRVRGRRKKVEESAHE